MTTPVPERRVAFAVAKWSHPTSVLAWAWLRQYFLDRDADKLFIVHSGKEDNWKVGGPLGADLETALRNWPHEVVAVPDGKSLHGLGDKYQFDVIVLGEDSIPRHGVQMVSVSEWVKTNIRRPFIIIRASAVRTPSLRISSHSSLLHPDTPPASSGVAAGRKIAIAYPNFTIGRHLIERAKQLVLGPQDEIFIVHCFSTETKVVKRTKTLLRAISLGSAGGGAGEATRSTTASEVTEDNSIAFGAKELEGYPKVHLNVVLKGDPRSAMEAFCDSEGIELLVISTRTGSRLRKTLSGGSVSGHLIDHAPCPCLVVPYKALGLLQEEEEAMSPVATGSASPTEHGTEAAMRGQASSSGLDTDAAAVATLQLQLEEKERVIAELREEVARLQLEAGRAGAGDAPSKQPAEG